MPRPKSDKPVSASLDGKVLNGMIGQMNKTTAQAIAAIDSAGVR